MLSPGIVIWDSDQTRIIGSEVHLAGKGMIVDFSSNTDIRDCKIEGSTEYGIWLYNITRKSTIIGNAVNASGKYGIFMETTNDNLISGNYVTNSSSYGILLETNARRNEIYNNRFMHNHGSYEVYDPNLAQAEDSGKDNVWFFESSLERIGNYWTDLQMPDLDDDGIIDEPYQIHGRSGSLDRYPMSFGYRKPVMEEGRKSGNDLYPTVILLSIIVGLVGFFIWKNISQSRRSS
jgi:parallel beta-helix repeat protein